MRLTVKEVATRAGVSRSLVYAWLALGVLPHYKVGKPGCRGKILVDEDELAGFLEGMKVEARPQEAVPALGHVKINARHG